MGVTLVTLGALVTMLGLSWGQGVHSPVLGAATMVRADYTVHSHDKKVRRHYRERAWIQDPVIQQVILDTRIRPE